MEERLSGILMPPPPPPPPPRGGEEGGGGGWRPTAASCESMWRRCCWGSAWRNRLMIQRVDDVCTSVSKGCARGRKDRELANSSIKIFMCLQGFGLAALLLLLPFPLMCASQRAGVCTGSH